MDPVNLAAMVTELVSGKGSPTLVQVTMGSKGAGSASAMHTPSGEAVTWATECEIGNSRLVTSSAIRGEDLGCKHGV